MYAPCRVCQSTTEPRGGNFFSHLCRWCTFDAIQGATDLTKSYLDFTKKFGRSVDVVVEFGEWVLSGMPVAMPTDDTRADCTQVKDKLGGT